MRQLRVWQQAGAHADLRAAGAHHGTHRIGGRDAVDGIHRDRRAARIVFVKAAAGVDEELGLGPRSEHHRELRAGDVVLRRAAVGVEITVDVEVGAVMAQARDDAQPFGDLQLLLHEEAKSQPGHGVLANRVVPHPIVGQVEAHTPDVFVARFHAEHQLPGEAAVVGGAHQLGVQSVRPAFIELFELVAVVGIEEVGEVGKQVQLIVERVAIAREVPVADRLFQLEVQRITMRFTTVAWDRCIRSGLTILRSLRARESGPWKSSCRRRRTR